jgi:hypothetical protein
MTYITLTEESVAPEQDLDRRSRDACTKTKHTKNELRKILGELHDMQNKYADDKQLNMFDRLTKIIDVYNNMETYVYQYISKFDEACEMIRFNIKSLIDLQKSLIACNQNIRVEILDFTKNPAVDVPMFRVCEIKLKK